MSVSRLDSEGDWTFGQQKAGYLVGAEEIEQNVVTRIKSFKGDWFLDEQANIDWFNILGNKDTQTVTEQQLSRTVLGTNGVRTINELNFILDRENRKASVSLTYTDIYDQIINVETGVS